MTTALPPNEAERLEALQSYGILDTSPEEDFDGLTRLAAAICGTPIASITLVDIARQWFKSRIGLKDPETPREHSFCARAILKSDLLIVPDALKDPEFSTNPFVTGDPNIRFYCGVPLLNEKSLALGTICVIDRVPRQLSDEQIEALKVLGRQVMAQLYLRKTLRELDRYFTLSIDMLCIAGLDGYFKRLNPAWQKILGHSTEDLLARPYLEFVHPEDRNATLQEAANLASGVDTVSFENRYLCKDGSYKWLSWSASPFAEQRSIYAVARDITELRQIQEVLVEAKEEAERANKFKDQFLSTMSHELRTPLNAVLGFSDLLADARYGPLNDRQQRYVNHIHTGGQHLLKLIGDILDLSKIEAGRMELTREDVVVTSAFNEVLSALQPLADKKSQDLRQQAAPALCVRADPTRFKQVLMNLVGNAIKFTPEGAKIELAARPLDGQIRVEVRDNGPGIPPGQQQRIFEAFVRLAQTGSATEGTGLGLAITSRLVELHGSKLRIESQPNEGTCFYFYLPLVTTAIVQSSQPTISVPRARKAPRILVVEDNAVTGQLIQSQLTSSGYEPLRCDQPERAADVAAELQPDAITLDLLMKPVHGLEVLLQLKNDPRTSKIPVIVVTIVDQPGIGGALGADEYLIKPVSKKSLLDALERCLQPRGGAAPTRAILVVEDDVSTREMMEELLTARGYSVITAADGAQARAHVANALPELVILDLVLPKMSGLELLAEWRASPRTADLPVFVLTSKDLTKEEEKYVSAHTESLFQKQNSWREPLIKQLERVVTSTILEAV